MAKQIAASIFDINTRTRAAALISLGCLFAVLMFIATAQAQTFTVLHTFTAGADGHNPTAGLTLPGSRTAYGVATFNASGDGGGVFKLTEGGSGWVLDPLFNHTGSGNSKLVIGPHGNLYGATALGGINACGEGGGCGTVFMLQPPATACGSFLCPWTETVLYEFTDQNDGWNPDSEVVFDAAGNLYGVTEYGGTGDCGAGGSVGCGLVYKLTRSGSGWIKSTIHTFVGGSDGSFPSGGLVFDNAGNLYGVAEFGGSDSCINGSNVGCGVLYELSPSNGGWTETILHYFQASDGSNPSGTLAMDPSGNLYGLASSYIFELSQPGTWNYALLYSFTHDDFPIGGLTFDAAGNLYGVTIQAGENGYGYVYKLTQSGGSWGLSHLHDFAYSDGTYANGLLTLDGSGNIYGSSEQGGFFSENCYPANGCGTAWEITP
jgi:hypothetical protein